MRRRRCLWSMLCGSSESFGSREDESGRGRANATDDELTTSSLFGAIGCRMWIIKRDRIITTRGVILSVSPAFRVGRSFERTTERVFPLARPFRFD